MLDSCGRPLARIVARTPWLRVRANAMASVSSMNPTVAGKPSLRDRTAGPPIGVLDDDLVLGPVCDREMDQGRHDRSHQRGNQEEPNLAERSSAHDEGRPEAPSRVHGRAREWNTDEVHDHQAEADGH